MAMLPELTHEPVSQSSVPMEITEFVEDLLTKAEKIQQHNTQLQKQIEYMKKKIEREKRKESTNTKHKIELLLLFKKMLEKRAKRNKGTCKNCSSLQSDLKVVKSRISDLLEEQSTATERVFDIKQDIELKKVHEEKKMHGIQELQQNIEKRKADINKHFRQTKFTAHWLRQEVKTELEFKARGDLVFAVQKEMTDIAISRAFMEIPTKIAAFEEELISEATKEAEKEIAKKDLGVRPSRRNDFYDITKDARREKYMKWI